jgi:hypothetical protein
MEYSLHERLIQINVNILNEVTFNYMQVTHFFPQCDVLRKFNKVEFDLHVRQRLYQTNKNYDIYSEISQLTGQR